jgi:hypothetical protein
MVKITIGSDILKTPHLYFKREQNKKKPTIIVTVHSYRSLH